MTMPRLHPGSTEGLMDIVSVTEGVRFDARRKFSCLCKTRETSVMVFRGSKIFSQNLAQHLTKRLRTGSGWDHVRIVCRILNFRLSEGKKKEEWF
ncbi:hypothetical protein CEXT_59031 [Caerostris extrusa]|uniref:Uncharacterized protein n=1 Tax=Caerostris extrusa TaxID=172846 RepID=A0AAV4PCB6_CAEEX|nr:hypothetical protein CEXT_59031 [Caerostris extrusa]